MRGDELAVRNEAILSALRRGQNVHRVAAEAELGVPTVRIIAMGGGVELTAAQRAKPDDLPTNSAARGKSDNTNGEVPRAPRRPDSFAEHLAEYDRRNAAIVEALHDPNRLVWQVCAEFGINEATLLTIGWHHHAWAGPRRPRGEERDRRNATIAADIRTGSSTDSLIKRWGLSAAHLTNLARDFGLPPPGTPEGARGRRTKAGRLTRNRKLAADLAAGMSVDDAADKYRLAPSTVISYAREHGVRVPRPPRAPSPPSARDQELVRRAVDGESFSDLSRSFDISRERVRQIVLQHDQTTAKDLASQRNARQLLAREERLALLAADRPDLTYPELSTQVGLPLDRVVVLLGAVEAARRAPLGEEHGFDVPAALIEMRRIYRLGAFKPLTSTMYDKHRRSHVVGSGSLMNKFGSWGAACAAANITGPEPKRRIYEREWTAERCLGWVGAFLLTGASVKSSDFRVWLEARQGPSVATVRNRCGLWGHTLRAAAALVTQPGWEPPPTPLRTEVHDVDR